MNKNLLKSTKTLTLAGISVVAVGGAGVVASANHIQAQKKADTEKQKQSDQKAASSEISTSVRAEKKNLQKLSNYTVVNGDTIASVASHFKVKEADVRKKFDLGKDDQLIPGTKMADQHAAIDKKKQDDASAASSSSQNTQNTNDQSTQAAATSSAPAASSSASTNTGSSAGTASSYSAPASRSYSSGSSNAANSNYSTPSQSYSTPAASSSQAAASSSSQKYYGVPAGAQYYNPNKQYADTNSGNINDMNGNDAISHLAGW